MNPLPGFVEYFRELWGRDLDPFPWQAMLAERVVSSPWPRALDLPTAAGKTACIDIAVYALAAQAGRPTADRTAPRRVWFVVDRRIVVDEAFERAREISQRLHAARVGPLREVADRLRDVSGTDRPLAVARLRGGILRDDGWARVPSQPAVITSTVDQLGSRLLFRAYGPSQLAAPIHAGLAANDSLIVLDEVHCSVPFYQTLRAIESYRRPAWSEVGLPTPFAFVVLSATPPSEVPASGVFPGKERSRALDHPVLARRLRTSKPAALVELKTGRDREDPLVREAARRALAFVSDGHNRVGVMANRVATAVEVRDTLRSEAGEGADVVLLTGRIRPFERDHLVARWKPFLRAKAPEDPPRPIVVVSTQCLEVGADFSFDALVTEAASLDALRQRFGRLARMGADVPARAAILARDRDVSGKDSDPIYGTALLETWTLLNKRAAGDGGEGQPGGTIDFGVEALDAALLDLDDPSAYSAPHADAPVLLPAHLDLLCQTSPGPHPEPDVQALLHGKERGAPEAQVVWRADLSDEAQETWVETVALCRPVSGEMLSVPLHRLRAWLRNRHGGEDAPDLEGLDGAGSEEAKRSAGRPFLLWRGRRRSEVSGDPDRIRPGDVVVVPASYGLEGFGQKVTHRALGKQEVDLWEPAWEEARRPPALRLHRDVLGSWLAFPPLKGLVEAAEEPAPDRHAFQERIDAVLESEAETEGETSPPPSWWLELLRRARLGRMEQHPAGGLVLVGRGGARRTEEPDLFADEEDLTSASGREVDLDQHTRLVRRAVDSIAGRCLPGSLTRPMGLAADWHDVGKLDERFQIMLRGGDRLAVYVQEQALAKSAFVPTSPAIRRAIREASGLPEGFRHEMLSCELLAFHGALPEGQDEAELVLHLVASHHGHARPFAPIVEDPEPPGVSGLLCGIHVEMTPKARTASVPAHRFESGLARRFWVLVRRYGWWGLAYLEAVFRLGDWYASGLTQGEPARDAAVGMAP